MANAIVSQSGGPTGAINASLVGVIEQACKHNEIANLYGAVHAVAGIVKEDFIDLKTLSADILERVAASPSSGAGSSRDKPDGVLRKGTGGIQEAGSDTFTISAANDSANTCHIINEMAQKRL